MIEMLGVNIFLDACIIIYWAEASEPFYSKLLAELQRIAEQYPDHTLVVSRLSMLECLVKPMRDNDKKIVTLYQEFFQSPDIAIVEIDASVIDIATQLRAQYNLRTPDAIQAASCLSTNQEHLFLTNDKQLSVIKELHTIVLG